jgi:glycerate kinase
LAIGGSATVDGGMGMMQALGFTFYNKSGEILQGNGENLAHIFQIDVPADLNIPSIKIICDVDNPLLGKNGAAHIFGPQKGATPQMVDALETGLQNWVNLLENKTQKKLHDISGAGAAGGIAVPLMAFFNAEMVPGANFITEKVQLEKYVEWADLVITGEGKIDSQTLNNKAPFAVARLAQKHNKPVFAIGGKVEKQASEAFDAMFCFLPGPVSLEYAMRNAESLLYNFAFQLARSLLSVKGKL